MIFENLPIITESLLPFTEEELNKVHIIPPSKHHRVAVLVDNFLRDKLLLNLLRSIFIYEPGVKIYIAEQGVFDINTAKLYQRLIKAGHEVIGVGFDAGYSRAHNKLLERTSEPFIIWCDCDNLFTNQTDIKSLIDLLEQDEKLGVVGFLEKYGNLTNNYEVNLEIKDRRVIYTDAHEKEDDYFGHGIRCDMTMNFCLAKSDLFNYIRWDNNLKLAEHLDTFLQIKYKSPYKVICSNHTSANQNISISAPEYNSYRKRNNRFWPYYIHKWGVDYLDGRNYHNGTLWKIPTNINEPEIIEKIESKPIIVLPKEPINDINKVICQFAAAIEKVTKEYCFVKDTCRRYMNHIQLKSPIQIATRANKSIIKRELLESGFTEMDDKYIKDGVTFEIDMWYPEKVKQGNQLLGRNYNVPFPVVHYLHKLFGMKWEKIND